LDNIVARDLKLGVEENTGYSVIDLREVSQAGVIDNLMRQHIRDSAFMISDLTHDNLGAYWEAGYAEGLGKPVIYICEQEKFKDAKTHFDTNHCTTVIWDVENMDQFVAELSATVRRSLNLF
jgi:nucleoside 2-deoxyribosyltransferase